MKTVNEEKVIGSMRELATLRAGGACIQIYDKSSNCWIDTRVDSDYRYYETKVSAGELRVKPRKRYCVVYLPNKKTEEAPQAIAWTSKAGRDEWLEKTVTIIIKKFSYEVTE